MATSNLNTAWKTDLYKFIDKTFEWKVEQFQNVLKLVLGEEDSQTIDFKLSEGGGYGEVPDYDGGSTITTMNQKRGFIKTITQAQKAGAIDIERLYAITDQSGEAKKAGTRAAISLNTTIFNMMLRMFAGAWTTSLGGDDYPWAYASHPVASKGDAAGVSIADAEAGTFSNIITGNPVLSLAAITTAQTAARRFVTPDGSPCSINLSDNGLLLISAELEPRAIELCGKNGRMIPDRLPESNENGANPIYGLQYVVMSGGADGFTAKQWAIADKTMLPEVAKIVYAQRPTTFKTELDNPLIARIVPYMAAAIGQNAARAVLFSNPA
jgi:hypothetical protein